MQLKNVPPVGVAEEPAAETQFDPATLDNRAAEAADPEDEEEEDEEDEGPIMRDFELKKIGIDSKDKVQIFVRETIEMPPVGDDDKSVSVPTDFPIKSKRKPHQEFKDALQMLRRPALDAWDVKLTTVEKNKFDVRSVAISGRLEDQTAKVTVILEKEVTASKKPSKVVVDSIAIFALPAEQQKVWRDGLNKVFKESFDFIDGKHHGKIQLGVFVQ